MRRRTARLAMVLTAAVVLAAACTQVRISDPLVSYRDSFGFPGNRPGSP